MAKPNNITRAIIDATVDRSIREIEEDPQRSIRKLMDMGKQFTHGRYLQDIYAIVQELLRDDNCPYYDTISHLLRNMDRKALKNFGITIGYNSLSFGGKIIRSNQEKKSFMTPWVMMIRYNPQIPGSIALDELENMIQQGQKLGIYTYIINCKGSLSSLESLAPLFVRSKYCAFFCILPDQELEASQLAAIKPLTNTMCFFLGDGASSAKNLSAMRRQKSLYGVYINYDNNTCDSWIGTDKMHDLAKYESAFILTIASDECSEGSRRKMSDHVALSRQQAEYPFLLFDLYQDAYSIDKVVSPNASFFEILENGDLHTHEGILTDFRHTTSLEHILTFALPYKGKE